MYAFQKDVSDYDVMTSRACGGSHTVINPNGWRGGKGYSWNNIPSKKTIIRFFLLIYCCIAFVFGRLPRA